MFAAEHEMQSEFAAAVSSLAVTRIDRQIERRSQTIDSLLKDLYSLLLLLPLRLAGRKLIRELKAARDHIN